jgi:hypothetical protein
VYRTLVMPEIWKFSRYNKHDPLSRRTHLKAPTPLDRGGISCEMTDFFSTNGALHAAKGTEEGDEPHVSLTRCRGKSKLD